MTRHRTSRFPHLAAALIAFSALWATAAAAQAPIRAIPHIEAADVSIDGDVSDWETLFGPGFLTDLDFASIAGAGSVPPSDLAVEVWLGWNESTNLIYVAAKVQDDVFGTTSSTNPGDAWRSDNIEIVIDADASGGQYGSDAATAQQYILNSGATQFPVLFPFVLDDPPFVAGAVTRVQNGDGSFTYQYEMAVPGWNLVDDTGSGDRHSFAAGQIVGMQVGFADFDSDADADAISYNIYQSLDGIAGSFANADGLSGFELLAPGAEPPATPLLITDYDANGTTDFDDFFLFADGYGRQADDPEFNAILDHDGDGQVGGGDLLLLADNFGSTDSPPLPPPRPGPNGGATVSSTVEDGRLVITVQGLTEALGAIVFLGVDPANVELGPATFASDWFVMPPIVHGNLVEIAASTMLGGVASGDIELMSLELSGDPNAVAAIEVILRGPGFGERDVLPILPPPPPAVPPIALPGRVISHIDMGELPAIDGDVGDWEALQGPPLLTGADFSSIAGALFGPVPAEDQGIEVWLGWNETTNLVYVGARVHDDAFATTTFTDPFNSWRSDDIEVVIDADGSAGLYDFEAATAQQYILNPGTGTPFLFPFGMPDPPDVDAAVSLSQNGDGSFTYQYELAIPGWSLIDDTGSGDRHTFTAGQIIGLALGFGDFESEADADAANYHAFGSLDGKVQAFFDANAMPGFELLAPGDEPPAAPLLVTDYDGSGATDFNDFFQFADGYGRLQDDPEFDATFDHDSNGDVNGADLFLFAENFGSAETPPVPEWIPGPNGGAQIHARYEETRIVITASGLSAATGALVLLDRDPEVAELGVATFVDNWPNMRLSRGSFVEIAATALGGTPIGGEVELASIEFTGDPGAIVPLNVVLRGPGLGERDVLSIEPPPPPIVPPHVLPGRTIVHVEPSDLPVIDGDVGDWEALLGPPLLTDVDFSSIAGTVFGPEVSPADQSIEVWLAWNQATNLLYIGDRRPGARQRVRHHHLHRPRQRLA